MDRCFNDYCEIDIFFFIFSIVFRVSVTQQDFISACFSLWLSRHPSLGSLLFLSSAVIRSHFLCSQRLADPSMTWCGVIDGGGAVLSKHTALNSQLSKMGGKLENSHAEAHTRTRPRFKKNIRTKRYDSGGWCWKGRRKKGGHLLATVSLPQSHTNTKARTFSGSQRTFGASCRGLSVSCSRRGPSVAFQSLIRRQEILKSPDVSIRFDLERRVKCVVSDVFDAFDCCVCMLTAAKR